MPTIFLLLISVIMFRCKIISKLFHFHKVTNIGRPLNLGIFRKSGGEFEDKLENHLEIPHVQPKSNGSIGNYRVNTCIQTTSFIYCQTLSCQTNNHKSNKSLV